MQAIIALPQPVIAQVQGIATAAGCQLVATCDLAIAADSARFATNGIHNGLYCATPQVALSRVVPRKHALEMLLTGDFISANEAYRIGLYNHLVDSGEKVVDAARNLAAALAKAPTAALSATKKALQQELSMDFSTALDQEAKLQASFMKHADFREAYNAFVAKRPPRFS